MPKSQHTAATPAPLTELEVLERLANSKLDFSGLTIPAFVGTENEWGEKEPAGLTDQPLRGASFRGSVLRGIPFGAADVTDADFQDADLTEADLSSVVGLTPARLAGANLTHCKLPEKIAAFPALTNVTELSKNAGALFSILLVGCAFVLLVAFTTKDVQLLLDSGTATLPVINLQVSPRLFLGVAPWVLLGQYITLHLYLQRLWGMLATLPALFPDALPLDKKTYPWLLNDFVRVHFPRLKEQPWPLGATQLRSMRFLAYWLGPLTALLIYLRCLMMQDTWHSLFQIAAVTLFFGAARLFGCYAGLTMERPGAGEKDKEKRERLAGNFQGVGWHRRNMLAVVSVCAALVLIGPAFLPLLVGRYSKEEVVKRDGKPVFVEGKPLIIPRPGEAVLRDRFESESLVHVLWRGSLNEDSTLRPPDFVMPSPLFVEMSSGEIEALSKGDTKTADKLKAERDKQAAPKWELLRAKVKRANLSYRSIRFLRFLQAPQAFFVNADFRRSLLNGANFRESQLQGADLRFARLQGADLYNAQLQGANLGEAHLQKANLGGAQLQGANLILTELRGANIGYAQLQGASLGVAKLQGANLGETQLQGANLGGAELQGANLGGARLQGAILAGAKLQGADLERAKLQGADLRDAYFSKTTTKWPDGIGKPPKFFKDPETGKTYPYLMRAVPKGIENPTGDPNVYQLVVDAGSAK